MKLQTMFPEKLELQVHDLFIWLEGIYLTIVHERSLVFLFTVVIFSKYEQVLNLQLTKSNNDGFMFTIVLYPQ